MYDEQVDELSESERDERGYRYIIYGISAFIFFTVLFFGFLTLSSCTYSVKNVMTSGTATDVAESDDDQQIDATTTLDPKPLVGL